MGTIDSDENPLKLRLPFPADFKAHTQCWPTKRTAGPQHLQARVPAAQWSKHGQKMDHKPPHDDLHKISAEAHQVKPLGFTINPTTNATTTLNQNKLGYKSRLSNFA